VTATRSDPRPSRRATHAAIVVGALWRIGVLAADKWHQHILLNDSVYYSAQARQIADGTWFREIFVDQPGAEHGPLTSLLLVPVSWMDDPLPWQRLATMLFGIASLVAIAHLGRLLGGERVAAIAAWIAAVYPNLWMNDGLVMSESLSVLLVTLTLIAAHRLLVRHRLPSDTRPVWADAASLGVLAGLAALARSELVLVAGGLVILVALVMPAATPRMRARAAGVALGAAVVVMAPWVAFNLSRFEHPVFLTTNDGTTLLGSYCDAAFSGPGMGGWNLTCVTAEPEYRGDEEPSVRSSRQKSIAFAYARAHVDELPKVVAARIGRTVDLFGLDNLVAQDVGEERYRWASWAGIISWWALAPCAAVGLWRMQPRWRRLLLLPVGSVLVTTVVFYGGHRIRSSLEPVAVVAAAAMLAAWSSALVRRRRPVDRADVFVPDCFGTAAALVEQASREDEHDDEQPGSVEVLEVTGPGGVDEVALGDLPARHEQAEDTGQQHG
jgi:4-amino-4-deoxy-L-arabinose transferase-like glycosyltransferase